MSTISSACVSLARWRQHLAYEANTDVKNQIAKLCQLLSLFIDLECPNRTSLQSAYVTSLQEIEAILRNLNNLSSLLDCSPLFVSRMKEEEPEERLIVVKWTKEFGFSTKKFKVGSEDVDFQGGRKVRQRKTNNQTRMLEYQCSTPKKNNLVPWSRSLLRLENSNVWIVCYRPRRPRGNTAIIGDQDMESNSSQFQLMKPPMCETTSSFHQAQYSSGSSSSNSVNNKNDQEEYVTIKNEQETSTQTFSVTTQSNNLPLFTCNTMTIPSTSFSGTPNALENSVYSSNSFPISLSNPLKRKMYCFTPESFETREKAPKRKKIEGEPAPMIFHDEHPMHSRAQYLVSQDQFQTHRQNNSITHHKTTQTGSDLSRYMDHNSLFPATLPALHRIDDDNHTITSSDHYHTHNNLSVGAGNQNFDCLTPFGSSSEELLAGLFCASPSFPLSGIAARKSQVSNILRDSSSGSDGYLQRQIVDANNGQNNNNNGGPGMTSRALDRPSMFLFAESHPPLSSSSSSNWEPNNGGSSSSSSSVISSNERKNSIYSIPTRSPSFDVNNNNNNRTMLNNNGTTSDNNSNNGNSSSSNNNNNNNTSRFSNFNNYSSSSCSRTSAPSLSFDYLLHPTSNHCINSSNNNNNNNNNINNMHNNNNNNNSNSNINSNTSCNGNSGNNHQIPSMVMYNNYSNNNSNNSSINNNNSSGSNDSGSGGNARRMSIQRTTIDSVPPLSEEEFTHSLFSLNGNNNNNNNNNNNSNNNNNNHCNNNNHYHDGSISMMTFFDHHLESQGTDNTDASSIRHYLSNNNRNTLSQTLSKKQQREHNNHNNNNNNNSAVSQEMMINLVQKMLSCTNRESFSATVMESGQLLRSPGQRSKFFNLVNMLQNSSWMYHFSPLTSQSRLLIYACSCIHEDMPAFRAFGTFHELFSRVFAIPHTTTYYQDGFWHRPFSFVKKISPSDDVIYDFISAEAVEVVEQLKMKLPPSYALGRPDKELFDETFAQEFSREDLSLLRQENFFLTDNTLPLPCKRNCGHCKVIASKIHIRLQNQSFIFACATAVQCHNAAAPLSLYY